jgi:hypothetical protein
VIVLNAFPLKLRIQIVPELNVMTIGVVGEKTTDLIFKDLIGFDDLGEQIVVQESEKITSES